MRLQPSDPVTQPAVGPLLTVEEAAAFLNVSVRFVRRIIHERRVSVVHLGRHVRLAQSDLEDFVAAGRSPALIGQALAGENAFGRWSA